AVQRDFAYEQYDHEEQYQRDHGPHRKEKFLQHVPPKITAHCASPSGAAPPMARLMPSASAAASVAWYCSSASVAAASGSARFPSSTSTPGTLPWRSNKRGVS